MTNIAVTSVDLCNSLLYVQVLEALGAEVSVVMPPDDRSAHQVFENIGGLLLAGGPDVDPSLYGASTDPDADLELCRPLDDLELRLLDYALGHDMPVLAICRGMQLLNVAFGGQLLQDIPNHRDCRQRRLFPGEQPAPPGLDGSPEVRPVDDQRLFR